MKTIKIIDLLNKIANGEEVPKKIKYCGEEFQFTGYDRASKNYINEFEDLFEILDGSMLNDEVEILEDEKKMPEKLYETSNIGDLTITYPSNKELMEKINEILDYLESDELCKKIKETDDTDKIKLYCELYEKLYKLLESKGE